MTNHTVLLTEASTADFTWDEEDLCELIRRLATALSAAQGEVEARWRTIESAPSFKDVLGLYFGGADHDIRSYHVVRQDTDGSWMCEGFSILAPRFWTPLPPQGGDGT